MIAVGPRARFRTYTVPRDYVRMIGDVALGQSASGDAAEMLEAAISDRLSVPYALCVPQARVGIYLAVKGLVRPGQSVVLSPYTIADVINMVICAGGVPVFADIDRPTTNITAAGIERLIDSNTGAVMVTHLHGLAADIEEIAAICRARDVPLIEDCAQAFGAWVGDAPLGTFGDAGIFSFGMYKNITSFYGGILTTKRKSLYEQARKELDSKAYFPLRRLLGKVGGCAFTDMATSPLLFTTLVYWIFRFGFLRDVSAINRFVTTELDTSRKTAIPEDYLRRMRPAQARMALRQLPIVDRHAAMRIRFARIYHEGLRDIPELIIPPFRDDGSHVYNYFPIQYRDRVELVKWLMRRRRDVAVQHLKNCASLPSFKPEHRDCPNAELTARELILLPNYPGYGEEEVRKNIDAIHAFFSDGRD